MATEMKLIPSTTYASHATALKAVEKMVGLRHEDGIRFMIVQDSAGRFYPLFVGNEAVRAGTFHKFVTVA
jgi:hypothetical protein